MLHRAGADGALRPRPALWRSRGTAGLRKQPASTCCSSGILQSTQPQAGGAERPGRSAGAEGLPRAAEAVRDERSGRSAADEPPPRGSRHRRSLRGGAQSCWSPPTPSPAPTAADSPWGAGPAPHRGRGQRRGVRAPAAPGFRGQRGALRGHASGKGPAGRRAGVGPAKSTWAATGFAGGRGAGPRGDREQAAAGAGSPLPRSFRTPHPVAGAPPRPQRTGARAPGRKASQPPGAHARAEVAASRPGGHLAGRGKTGRGRSVRTGEGEAKCGQGACAV